MKFAADELPYTQLEALGLKKKDVLSLPSLDLNALLSGRRSGLLTFKNVVLPGIETIPALDAKLSLVRNADSSVSLRIHPINKVAPNIFNLSAEELSDLTERKTDVLEKKVTKENGEKEDMLIQYDPETREFVGKNIKEINAPKEINGTKLTDQQRSDWKHGKEVNVEEGPVRIDLRSAMGFIGHVFLFALDGGITLAISSLMKNQARKEEQKKEDARLGALKVPVEPAPFLVQEPKAGLNPFSPRTEKTLLEKAYDLPIPTNKDHKWVQVDTSAGNDRLIAEKDGRLLQSKNEFFLLVEKSDVGKKEKISFSTYMAYEPIKTEEVLNTRTEKTDFEKKYALEIPALSNKTWVKVVDNNPHDGITVADNDRFVQVDKDRIGDKEIITLDEYTAISADKSDEVSVSQKGENRSGPEQEITKGRGR